MSTRVTLITLDGPLAGREFVFTDYTFCLLGRSADCQLHLPAEDTLSLTASRRHCMILIDPPRVRVRDLDSLNGTFVNSKQIGRREKGSPSVPAEVELHDGDRLVVGNSEFLIEVQDTPEENTADAQPDFLREPMVREMSAPVGLRHDVCI